MTTVRILRLEMDLEAQPRWRRIVTDSESLTGIAPTCPRQNEVAGPHDCSEPGTVPPGSWMDSNGVYDCCPLPHLECGGDAQKVVDVLNENLVSECQ